MKLQTKLWLGMGLMFAVVMGVDLVLGYRSIEAEVRQHLDEEARIVRAMLMATRRVYHQQFMDSGIALSEKTVGFLPAHALSRISQDFPHWIDSGLRFNNVSDRARNPFNQADPDELAAMEWFRHNPSQPDRIDIIRSAQGASYYHFTAPIWIEPYCLACHGDRDAAPPSIRQNYAQAYGYKVGDLRGVMSIKLPMDELRSRVTQAWLQRFWLRTLGYGAMMLVLGYLTRRLVTRPLAAMAASAKRLEIGDLSARVPVAGDDEVTTLARHFNSMAASIEQHDAQVLRLNQIYAALSETNQSIVRIGSEEDLVKCICRIAVTFGGMALAWIGRASSDRSHIDIITAAGSGQDYLEELYLGLDPGVPEGRSPAATAWLNNIPVIVQDYFNDPCTEPWRPRASHYHWGSVASFPIVRCGQVHLILTLYHTERFAFDQKIVALLTEMAMDIGFALDRFDLIERERNLGEAIRESEQKYRAAVTTSLDGFWLMDPHGRLLEVNEAYERFSGYERGELLRQTIHDLEAVRSREDMSRLIEEIRHNGTGLFETRHKTRHGSIKPLEISITYMPEQGGLFSVFLRDLSMREAAEARITHLSHYDALTGLPNLTLFADRVSQALAQARRNDEPLALVFLDIDHFKNINDVLGHRIGDRLLVELTTRLQKVLRQEDTISRQGGDEFLLLLPHANAEKVAHVAEKLLQTIAERFVIEHHELIVTASLGIALYPNDGQDFETLLRKSDTAANWAKQQGRNTYRFFAEDMQAHSTRIMQLETALRRALERDELLLHYQPQVSLESGQVVGVEALIRWNQPSHGLISPAEFIPIAESSGLILPIGHWVLETALRQLKTWMDQGLPIRQVAVNLSAIQFRQLSLAEQIQDLLAKVGLPPACLELELTESVMMEDPQAAIRMMERLHAAGVRISIDDFGTGYSSLSYLKRIRIDKLKIDQSFVRDLSKGSEDGAIVQAIINLAQTLNFTTIAEGVETEEQLQFLRTHRCHEIQGYLFSRPLPPEQIPEWLQRWRLD